MCQCTHATTNFYMQCGSSADTADDLAVDGLTICSTIKVNNVQPARSGLLPALCYLDRVGIVGCDLGIVSLVEPHAAAIFDINGGKNNHSLAHLTKFLSNCSPIVPLFSGWNCVPHTCSVAITLQ